MKQIGKTTAAVKEAEMEKELLAITTGACRVNLDQQDKDESTAENNLIPPIFYFSWKFDGARSRQKR